MLPAYIIVLIYLIISIILIWKSSDWVTDSLVPVAKKLGISYVVVTTILVSFVISLPEIISSVYSYMLGQLEIGIGVIIGSIMSNIGLTIGLCALIRPLNVDKAVVVRDGIFMVVVSIILLLFGYDLHYSRVEGITLFLMFVPYALNVWSFERLQSKVSKAKRVEHLVRSLSLFGNSKLKLKPSVWTFLLGAGVLAIGSLLFGKGLVGISKVFPNLNPILIGLVFGTLGTALPNVAAAIQGTLKGYDDAAMTETFGSNIFTMLITLGIIIVLEPFDIKGRIYYFDIIWMIIVNLLVVLLIFKNYYYKGKAITRFDGLSLVLFYLILVIVNAIGI